MMIEGLYIVRNPGPHSTRDDILWYVRDLRHLANLIFGSPPHAVDEERWVAYTNNVEATKDADRRLARRDRPKFPPGYGYGPGGKARKRARCAPGLISAARALKQAMKG